MRAAQGRLGHVQQWDYQLWQDGVMVAAVSAGNKEDALREINHYAMMYSQDGPVEIRDLQATKGSGS